MTSDVAPAALALFALGGTIAMTAGEAGGVSPALTADDLLANLEGLSGIVLVKAETVLRAPSADLGFDVVANLAERVRGAVAAGAVGVVVTQGTDTLEETAFLLDLLLDLEAPVVITGALRDPAQAGADGPANLSAALRVAACPEARGLGVMVVVNDEIHAARFVRKAHVHRPSAFVSSSVGPIGWIAEGRVKIALRPASRLPKLDWHGIAPDVVVLPISFGDDGRLLRAMLADPPPGVVIQALGAGHTPSALVDMLAELARTALVVLASRTGAGQGFRDTYGYPGGEMDLLRRGLISAGSLDAPKARILLSLLLGDSADRARIERVFLDI